MLKLSGKRLVVGALVAFALVWVTSVAEFAFGFGFAPSVDGKVWRIFINATLFVGPLGIPPFFMVLSFWLHSRGRRICWIGKGEVLSVLITEFAVLVSNVLAVLINQGEFTKSFVLVQMGTVFTLMLLRSGYMGRAAAKEGWLPKLEHKRTDHLWAALAGTGLIGGALLVLWAWKSTREGTFTGSLPLLGTGIDVVGAVLMAAVTKFAQFGQRVFQLQGWGDSKGNVLRVALRSCGKMVLLAVSAGYLSIAMGIWGASVFTDRWHHFEGVHTLVVASSVFLLALKGTVGDFIGTFLALNIMSGEGQSEEEVSEEFLIQ
ncbi:hypothetical protein KSX_50280 [Ktedonospora formicarum]|uniref:Uncharacterized protein n=2 Tax=Ktedonospora formicarum TaxID=2778364 RepID=A0A8J3MVU3_9CHLR|nr:hypothetical protein KSX_50280 [Ktedonospora formicarum]